MAGIFFTAGENKKRSGVYQRYEKAGKPLHSGASDGIVACVINSTWGPLNEVINVESESQAKAAFGSGGNTGVITQIFAGGASVVRVCRVGVGGKQGNATVGGISVTAKYVGTRALNVAIKQALEDENYYEFYVYENGSVLEKYSFIGSTAVTAVAEKINASSQYVTASASGEDLISAAVGSADLAGGENPAVSNADYSTAFVALEPYRWNTICVDTNTVDVHALLAAYMSRTYQDGKTGIAVVGEPITVDFTTRLAHAGAFNDYKVCYVGGGWRDSNDVQYDGFLAAARMAGVIASVPSSQSITHKTVSGAVAPAEMLTNSQYESCIDSGMIMFSASPNGYVWIEAGITTLVNPTGEDDEGWKKVKRVKVRYEMMDRVNDAVAPLVGQINNDEDGRATVVQTVQGILNKMISERKIESGASVILDTNNTPTSDSAWFVIAAQDIDALEKVYFTYKFDFASAS